MTITEFKAPQSGTRHKAPPAVLLSLAEFVKAGFKPRTPLGRAIVTVLVIKLVVVISMRVFLFSGDARPVVDEAAMSSLIGPTTHAPQ